MASEPVKEAVREVGRGFGGHGGHGGGFPGGGGFGRNFFGDFGGRFGEGRGEGCGAFGFISRHRKVVIGVVLLIGAVKVFKYMKKRKLRAKWNSEKNDVVVLHTKPRADLCPNLVPFSMKLETFFRMVDIKYVVDFEEPFGPKNKIPWITLNGQDYSDTELIIRYLQSHYNKHPDEGLSEEDKALGLAIQVMAEEHLYWGLVSWRFLEDPSYYRRNIFDLPFVMTWLYSVIRRSVTKAMYLQGLGRHTVNDLHMLMKRDMAALSTLLGKKSFFLGEEPHLVDCAVFGLLSQFYWQSPESPYQSWINNEYTNLRDYVLRMKDRFWPDWNKCIKRST